MSHVPKSPEVHKSPQKVPKKSPISPKKVPKKSPSNSPKMCPKSAQDVMTPYVPKMA